MLTKSDKQILTKINNSCGWTFAGDNIFKNYDQGKRILSRLVKKGLMESGANEYGTQYTITPAGKEELRWN